MRTLKLGGLAKEWRSVQFQSVEQYVSDLLEIELKEREINRINRLVKTAGFRVIKTLDEFIWTDNVTIPTGITRAEIESLSFLDKKNLIMLGGVGLGKPHLGTALSLLACQRGRRTRFFTAASLANILLERNNKGTLNSFLTTLNKVELMVISVVLLCKTGFAAGLLSGT